LNTAPGSAKAGDALLKIGLCHRRLRDEASARLSWQRVIREFPRSESAVKARAFLGAGSARR
jgi:TolA-binding protein